MIVIDMTPDLIGSGVRKGYLEKTSSIFMCLKKVVFVSYRTVLVEVLVHGTAH